MAKSRVASPALLLASVPVLLGFQLPFFDRWISFMDEGHILLLSDILAGGGELYRDATTYPLPGAYYLLGLVFSLVEPSNLVARWLVAIEFTVFGVCVAMLLQKLVSPRLAPLGLLLVLVYRVWSFPHWQVYTYSATALCLLAAALVLLLRFLESGNLRVLATTGLLAGLGILCKQDYGAAGLLAVNLVLVVRWATERDRSRERLLRLLTWLNGPALAAGVLTLGYFAWHGLLFEMLRQTVWNHLAGIASFEYSSLPPILPLFSQDPGLRDPYGVGVYTPAIMFTSDWAGVTGSLFYTQTSLYEAGVKTFFYAPYVIALLGGLRLARRRQALRDPAQRLDYLRELSLYALATLLLLSLNKPKDYVHMAILYWPFLCLLVVYAGAFARARPRLLPLFAAALLLPAGPALGYTARLAWQLRAQHSEPLRTERGGIYVTPSQAELIDGLVEYVREHSEPDEPVAVFPYYPMISFLSDRRGPHAGSYLIWPVGEFEDRDRVIIESMERTETDVVVYHFTQWNQFPRVDAYAPELFAYLVQNFEIDRVFSEEGWGYMFGALRRSHGQPEGQPLLDGELRGATLRLETSSEPPRLLEGEARDEFVSRALWPFRPVVALRPQADGGRTVLSVPVEVPEGARLRTSVGVHPRFWFNYPASSVEFTIAAVSDNGASADLLFSQTLDPHLSVPDRRWFEVDVPLDAYAGRTIRLEFATSCQRPVGQRFEMAGWGAPRLVVPRSAP